ncbi:alpha/beta fold hydrolase [Lysobacter enzymogenes]|uniref:alpha/beta fold hydrolase n=1 Tax=Lysobacter enzymogenes TaxID=69 RepID=UPI001A96A8DA|nr:alpha/beta hydrolase [Lysobacter enzymogenes]QQP97542.1 alpha/beta hydrolase [Lysobacter enzymogenes]
MLRTALFLALAVAATAPASAAEIRDADAPTVILAHGAFADGASWDKVVPILHSWGVRAVAVHEPLSSLHDDADAVRRAIRAAPGPVVLVGHSWGGSVITEAGADPKVKSLVYVAAFAPDVGQNSAQQGQNYPQPPGLAGLREREGWLWLDEANVVRDFAPDLKPRQARVLASLQAPIKASAFAEPLTQAAWRLKPSWYVIARNDRMLSPQLQADTARRIGAQVRSAGSGHAVPLAQPREVAFAILEAAGISTQDEAQSGG